MEVSDMTVLLEMLCLVLIVVHHKLFGDPTVTCVATDKTVTLSYKVKENIYTFISTQYIYTIFNNGILKYSTCSYFYKVKLTTNSLTLESEQDKCYKSMCPRFLKNTSYPHRLAINAHFKSLVYTD